MNDDVKKLALILLVTWSLVVLASLIWNIHQIRQSHLSFLQDTARLMFDHIQVVREWNARHGGVYAPVTEYTQPNEYLKDPKRDIRVNDKLTLTLINPAYMTRQIAELAQKKSGIQLHITSLDLMRPENKPTDLEHEALLAFEQGDSEFTRLFEEKSGNRFFYMAPLVTTHACLRCHQDQGYEEGDLRGGISITIPKIQNPPIMGIALGHGIIGGLGILFITVMSLRLSTSYNKIHQQSIIDPLTGIPNRRHFVERMGSEYRRASRNETPLTLIVCDIDFFKRFNDSLGHLDGDNCLVKVAGAIQASLQRGGDLCARYGGEEFIVVLPNTDQDGGLRVARQIQREMATLKIAHPDSPISDIVTLSIGVATDMHDYPSQNSLIKRADEALYRCKNKGRNRIEFIPAPANEDEEISVFSLPIESGQSAD